MDKYLYIKEKFEENEDRDQAQQMEAYMRNQFNFYGYQAKERREIYKDFLKGEKKNKKIDWEFLDQCWEDDHREFQYLVKDYLKAMEKYLSYEDIPKIEKYIRRKSWWDTVDGLDKIVGNIGLVDPRVDELMLQWSTDQDFWIRRAAIDHQLSRKEKTNEKLLEEIIVNNFGSDEFFINKAIGWSLRDYSKTNPSWVRKFIEKYKDQMDSLSIKEGSKYI